MRQEESSGRRGKGRLTLMQERADNGPIASSALTERRCADRTRSRERGQALVEFALIAPLFIALVVGVIQFGVVLNYWLDTQRIANQGARWAVVNNWPTCPRGSDPVATPCTKADNPPFPAGNRQTLRNILHHEAVSQGLTDSVNIEICYPDDGDAATPAEAIGTPVRVLVDAPFTFQAILDIASIDIHAEATMRLEQEPSLITEELPSCPT
jgi:TadE-like protein